MFLMERIRQFVGYSNTEKRDLLITILAVSFIFAYNDGRESFNIILWLGNYLIVMLFVTIAFIGHTLLQQVFALHQGFRAEYRAWPAGLIMGVIMTVLTNGKWFIILAGGLWMHHLAIHRIGKFRYGLNIMAQANVAAAGPIANLVLATFAIMMGKQFHILPAFFDQMAMINFWIMIFSLLPIPRLDGIHIFFASRLFYVFIFTTLLAYVLLTLIGVYSWIIAILIGGVCWLLYWIYIERK